MIEGDDAVAFGQRRLADVIQTHAGDGLRGRERGQGLAGVDVARRGDRLDARGADDVGAGEIVTLHDRVVVAVDGTGVERNAHAKRLGRPQTLQTIAVSASRKSSAKASASATPAKTKKRPSPAVWVERTPA